MAGPRLADYCKPFIFLKREVPITKGKDGPGIQPDDLLNRIDLIKLIDRADADALNQAMQTAQQFLKGLHNLTPSGRAKNHLPQPLLRKLRDLMQDLEPQKLYILFYGSTGVGKTATIQSILDVDNLLPEKSYCAGTAAVTSIHYNDEDRKGTPFRLEIEYIDRASLEQELEVALAEYQAVDDLEEVSGAAKCEVEITLNKISAINPQLDAAVLQTLTFAELMLELNIDHLLDDFDVSYHEDASALHDYAAAKLEGQAPDVPRRLQKAHWPLIKEMRIYMPHPMLAKGLVLVDLPGLNDRNTARAAVAENYKKKSSQHWVVAPINRAVDDIVAEQLIEKGLQHQLEMDGLVNSLVVILTKSDAMRISNASKEFPHDKEISATLEIHRVQDEKLLNLKKVRKSVQNELKPVEQGTKDNVSTSDDGDTSFSETDEVFTAPIIGKKRKRASTVAPMSSSTKPKEDEPTKEYIEELRTELAKIDRKIRKCSKAVKKIKNYLAGYCISLRNERVKEEFQDSWNRHIRGMSTDDATSQQAELSQSRVHCFCISNSAYQFLSGRSQLDSLPLGFDTEDDTEIPALIEYCSNLIDHPHRAAQRTYLKAVVDFYNIMNAWIVTADQEQLEYAQRGGLKAIVQEAFQRYRDEVHDMMGPMLVQKMKTTMEGQIKASLRTAVTYATEKAVKTSHEWRPVHWATYRAICMRGGGPFSSSNGKAWNWNDDLAKPITLKTMHKYTELFGTYLPINVKVFSTFIETICDAMFAEVYKAVPQGNILIITLLRACGRRLKEKQVAYISKLEQMLVESRKEAWRTISPAIRDYLYGPAYRPTQAINGRGSHKARQALIETTIDREKVTLFDHAAAKFTQSLDSLIDEVQAETTQTLFGAYTEAETDCLAILGDADAALKTDALIAKQSRKDRVGRELVTAAQELQRAVEKKTKPVKVEKMV